MSRLITLCLLSYILLSVPVYLYTAFPDTLLCAASRMPDVERNNEILSE